MLKLALAVTASLICASADAGTFVINYHSTPPLTRSYEGVAVSVDEDRGSIVFRASAPGQWSDTEAISKSGFEIHDVRFWRWLVPLEPTVPGSWEMGSGNCSISVSGDSLTLDCDD